MLGELAHLGDDLATAANAAASTNGVEIDAEFAGSVEDVCAALNLALAPRRGENDANGIGH